MCGIVGFIQNSPGDLPSLLAPMMAALNHRGPDDGGGWIDQEARVALGHRRLSILDLSPEGHQPMVSPSGRFVITFNGEIYNYRNIKKELASEFHFRGGSDTEVMLAAFEKWGIEEALQKFVGMFAFGVWDRRERLLTLARDRMGEKPLYYGWCNSTLIFGSDLGALERHPHFESDIDRDAAGLLIRYGYIPAPYSIFRGLFKLPPGTTLAISVDGAPGKPANFSPFPDENVAAVKPRRYWSIFDAARRGIDARASLVQTAAMQDLEDLLHDAVQLQMIADVPLGAFLSGGIDSSLVAALMQAHSSRPVKTFSVGFDEPRFNEAPHAAAVARHLGTDHTELYIAPEAALGVVPHLTSMYTEPFADSSQIPTYLVAKLAREQVTVALSGDGGDELFCGYPRYRWCNTLWNRMRRVPYHLRRFAARSARGIPPHQWDLIGQVIAPFLRSEEHPHRIGRSIQRGADFLDHRSQASLYRSLLSFADHPGELIPHARDSRTDHLLSPADAAPADFLDVMMLTDQLTYLPDDILVKVDRAGMAVSLESRIPFLDHRVVEYAWRIPPAAKNAGGEAKSPLRRILARYVPSELIDRPKMGFGVPLDEWLRGPLRPWVEDLLEETSLRATEILSPPAVRAVWTEHLSMRRDSSHLLWSILTLQSWCLARSTAHSLDRSVVGRSRFPIVLSTRDDAASPPP